MSAILKEDPPELSVTNQNVSPALERVIRHCLEKTPERRLHSAHDLAFELESLTQTSGAAASVPARRPLRIVRLAAVAAAVAAIVGAFLMGRRASPAPAAAPRTYLQLTSLSGMETSPAVSPDGQVVAFAKIANRKSHIWNQRSGGQNSTDLTPDCNEGTGWPAFSPDGNLVAYSSRCGGSGLFLMGATGESARRLTTFGDNPAWSPDGREIVFSTESGWVPYNRNTTSELWAADVATGKTRKLFAGDAVQPAVSPHALRIAYWGLPHTGSQRDVWTIPYAGLASGEKPVAVTQGAAIDWNPAWSADGRFLYFLSNRDGSMNLWRVPIGRKTGKPLGAPEPRTLPAREVGGFGLSRDGRLVAYVALELTYFLERLTIDPASGEARGQPVQVIQTSRAIGSGDTSPDGKLVVFDSQGSVQEDIFLAQADGTKVRHLTDDAARDRSPSFLPEGRRIAFQSDRGGSWDIWTILPDGSGLTQVTRSSTSALAPYPSPDGRRIAASDGADAFVFELDDKGGLAKERKLPRLTGTDVPYAAGWTPDSKKLLVSVSRNDGTVASLALFSLDSGRWETVPALPGMTIYASVMPPDRLIAQTREGIVVGKLSAGPTRLLAAHPPNSTYTTLPAQSGRYRPHPRASPGERGHLDGNLAVRPNDDFPAARTPSRIAVRGALADEGLARGDAGVAGTRPRRARRVRRRICRRQARLRRRDARHPRRSVVYEKSYDRPGLRQALRRQGRARDLQLLRSGLAPVLQADEAPHDAVGVEERDVGAHRHRDRARELPGVDAKMMPYFSASQIPPDPRRDRMTLRDVLTMTTGIRWDEESTEYTDPANNCAVMEGKEDWVRYVLEQPMAEDPGKVFVYNSGATMLLSELIRKTTGKEADDYAKEHLFAPLGIEYFWKRTPKGLADTEGGLYLAPRDLAKIGYLYLKDGSWDGKRILPEGWVKASTAASTHTPDGSYGYGYQWWVMPRKGAGTYDAYAAWGTAGSC